MNLVVLNLFVSLKLLSSTFMITGMYKYVCTRNRTQSGVENTLEFILSYEIFATDTVYIFLHVTSARHFRGKVLDLRKRLRKQKQVQIIYYKA